MKSPFPGMDPYLEAHWGDIHARLATYTSDQLNLRLPPDLVARSEEYVTVATPDDERIGTYVPDAAVLEYPTVPAPSPENPGGVAVAEPLLIRVPAEPRKQRRVLVTAIDSGHRVVTAIEFLSPANKVGEDGRAAYRRKRRDFLAAKANVVEIDLLRAGGYVLYPAEELLAERAPGPYRVCVVRGWDRLTAAVYSIPIRQPLPAFRVPLRPADPDAILELQPLIEQAYQNGRYARTLDYRRDPDPPLAGDDAAWADQLLRAAGKR